MQPFIYFPALPPEEITDAASGNGPLFPYAEGAPLTDWARQAQLYAEDWYYYSGAFLEEVIDSGVGMEDRSNKKFPIGMNIIESFVDMHGMLIWGASPYDELVNFFLKKRDGMKMSFVDNDPALDALEIVLDMNRRKTLLRQMGIIMQVFGGTYLRVAVDSSNPIGVTVMAYPPNIIYPVFDIKGNIMQLWMSYYINGAQARELGYRGEIVGEHLVYVEYWDKNRWEVRIESETISSGKNKYKAPDESVAHIPFVYVPRRLVVGEYGKSLVQTIIGTTREINSRAADYGDTIADASKPVRFGKNLRGQEINVNNYRNGDVITLADTFSDMPEPELDQLPSPTLPPDASDYIDWLKQMSMLLSFTSPVVFGIDEGSQRSAETLSARALPTITSVNDSREAITDGLNRAAQLIWRALRWSSEVDFKKSADELRRYKIIVQFSSILARDRQALITEEATLVGAGIRSMKKAIESLGDVYNVDEERDLILQDVEDRLELEQKYAPDPFGGDMTSPQSGPTGVKKNASTSNTNGTSKAAESTTNRARAAKASATK